jgi:hypothetical protein
MSEIPTRPKGEIDPTTASRLLALGRKGGSDQVEAVIRRMMEPDGRRWFASIFASGAIDVPGDPESFFLRAQAPLPALVRVKEACKELYTKAPGEEEKLLATIGYFLAVAAALVHHGVSISSRPRSEVDPILLDLACALPEPWVDLLAEAALMPDPPGSPAASS